MTAVAAARGGGADPSSLPPVGGSGGGRGGAVGGLDYLGTLTDAEIVALVRLASELRRVVRRRAELAGASTPTQRNASTAEAKRAGWARLPALLAVSEARRPKLSTMQSWARKIGVPADVIDQIAARYPAGIAPE